MTSYVHWKKKLFFFGSNEISRQKNFIEKAIIIFLYEFFDSTYDEKENLSKNFILLEDIIFFPVYSVSELYAWPSGSRSNWIFLRDAQKFKLSSKREKKFVFRSI